MKACFLDTCAVIQILAGNQSVAQLLTQFDELMISHVVLGELIFGCRRSVNPEREKLRVYSWMTSVSVVAGTPKTSEVYGDIAADLETRGLRITQNDMWIAALCVQQDFPLISSDAHFSRPAGLQWISY